METHTEARSPGSHGLPAHEIVLLLATDARRGLSEAKAAERLKSYGPNVLPAVAPTSPLVRLLRQLSSPLVLILLVSGGVALVLGEPVDAAVIFGVVVVNAVIGYLQEARAEAALDALRSMVHTQAAGGARRPSGTASFRGAGSGRSRADRGGRQGARGPAADRRSRELQVDESALTGESVPVVKDEDGAAPRRPVADRAEHGLLGDLVTSGTGARDSGRDGCGDRAR